MNKANRKVLLGIAEQAKVLAADMREFNEKHDRSNTGQAVSEPAITPRLVKLQVNTTGAWRNVLDFDCADSARVLNAAENPVHRHQVHLARESCRVTQRR